MTKEQFLQTSIENISQVYLGKRNHCRCGCAGDYTATSFMKNPRSQINNKLITQRLKKAKYIVENGGVVQYGDSFVDVKTGINRCLTFYYHDVVVI